MELIKLFWSFIQVGLFSFGGGYAALPLIQKQVVDAQGWLSPAEFIDIITISQMTPGPIAINTATFVGLRVGGLAGAVVATLGCVLPSFIIVLTIAVLFFRHSSLWGLQAVLVGIRPAIVGLIAAAGISILAISMASDPAISWQRFNVAGIDAVSILIFAASILALRRFKKDPIMVMAGAGAAGLLLYQAALRF